jgi:membrane protein required for colicin V production
MTPLDWVLVVVWLGIGLTGFWKGAIQIVFTVGGVVAGVWLALTLGDGLSDTLAVSLGPGWVAEVLGRLLPVMASVGLAALAGWGLVRTLEALHLGWVNRVLGFLLAAAAGGLLLLIMVAGTAHLSPAWSDLVARSRLVPAVTGWVGVAQVAVDEAAEAEPSTPDPTATPSADAAPTDSSR